MFYPVDSLRRGGRFYLCWVADSWPLRFATITHRQLWSQDIRKICDDLLEVMTNESGRPNNRFSLRLSSQLMRGLARLYQRKVTVFLSDLCMINAHVIKQANKKYNVIEAIDLEEGPVERRRPALHTLPRLVVEEPEVEPRLEELIQNSGNVVSNIQDITLKEATIPSFQLPPNDGFGEENPDQALQFLMDRTVEMMMVPTEPSAHLSGHLELPGFDSTTKSHDKSRLVGDLQMERISEHDMTMFRKSTGEGLLAAELDKEIPEIPDIPIPELPPPEKIVEQEDQVPKPVEEPPEVPIEIPVVQNVPQPEDIEELEELEPPQPKRRRVRGLIIDKKIKISAEVIRARIENNNVELRCEDPSDDIISLRVPFDIYMRRPAHAGWSLDTSISSELCFMLLRNLAGINRPPVVEREVEAGIMQRSHRSQRSILQRIEEVEEPIPTSDKQIQGEPLEANITYPDLQIEARVSENITETVREQDIAEMLTQKIDTVSQAKKRSATADGDESPKRPCSMGYVSFRESQKRQKTAEVPENIIIEPEIPLLDTETNKENISNYQTVPQDERNVTAMLQAAGLADIPTNISQIETQPLSQRVMRPASDTSEPQLGSLDRTKVSLGDSEQTTESKRFIRERWGTEGTMITILKAIKAEVSPINVDNLLANGPRVTGYTRIIAARCFSSILKLKQHRFIVIKKHPETLEIENIFLGPKFQQKNI